jgi:DNA-binding response OmpR family regulator
MAAKKNKKPQILIVDDDKDILDITCDFLEGKGYKVLPAGTGKEALKKTRTSKPNLILLDVMMPKMDGFWLCRVIKSDPKLQNIPIIFLTAKDDAQSRIEGQKCGGDDYLTKPFDLDALDLRIKAQLNRMSKDDIVEKIEESLDIPEPRGFLTKLNQEELSTLLKQIEAKVKTK